MQPQLLAASLREAENLAVRLALGHISLGNTSLSGCFVESDTSEPLPKNCSLLSRFRSDLEGTSRNADKDLDYLFDTAAFTRHAERAYGIMWEIRHSRRVGIGTPESQSSGTLHIIVGEAR